MDPIIQLAASALPNEKKYVLFAGAGVSKDAGVPSSWDLMLKTASLIYAHEEDDDNVDLEKWFIESEYSEMEYSELIGTLYPTSVEQQDFLDKYLNNNEIGDIHKSIAKMAQLGIIRCIITTNFDNYIEKALEEKGIKYQVISNDEDLNHSEPLIQCKSLRIYKPNGTLGKGALKNTPKDLEKYSEEMENELIRIFNEHGVIVLGYSGRDSNIQKVIQKANFNHYSLFWVDPNLPHDDMEKILNTKDNYYYIECKSANKFILDYFNIVDRLKSISPRIDSGPSIVELKNAFSSPDISKAPLYQDFLENILKELKNGQMDYSEFEEYDDAVVKQIENGKFISYNFIEGVLLACKNGDREAITTIYTFFGDFMNLYYENHHDGYVFLIYEFFVSFIAGLIKYHQWELIGEILSKELFVEKSRTEKYLKYNNISRYIPVLDEIRNDRLSSPRMSIMADMIRERFINTSLSELITHKKFMEADYFLFLRAICESDDDDSLIYWCPRSCVYLEEEAPTYIEMAERKPILDNLSNAMGIKDSNVFIERLSKRHVEVRVYPKIFEYNNPPLNYFDFNKLGSRE